MATKLTKEIRREIEIDGEPFTVAISPTGVKLTKKRFRSGRALSWQLTDPTGKPVVRERVWVSFAPGEIRTCANCHGLNTSGHGDELVPVNPPAALESLMSHWLTLQGQALP